MAQARDFNFWFLNKANAELSTVQLSKQASQRRSLQQVSKPPKISQNIVFRQTLWSLKAEHKSKRSANRSHLIPEKPQDCKKKTLAG